MESSSRPLEMVFLPFLIPSHMIPLFETARLFASLGQRVTIITTPSNAADLRPTVDADAASGRCIYLHVVPLPTKEVGLPDGIETITAAAAVNLEARFLIAFGQLRPSIEDFILTRQPDCIVSDMYYHWTVELAARLRIPRLHYYVSSLFSICVQDKLRRPNSVHFKPLSDYEQFIIPNLPHAISMTRSRLPDYIRDPKLSKIYSMDQVKQAELNSYGLLINSFYELEPAYTDHHKKLTGIKVFNVGPVALIHKSTTQKAERIYEPVFSEMECLSWLSSKKPNTVIYVSFGTTGRFSDEQLMEIACGLEAAGQPFIWVVHGKDDSDEEDDERWLPTGFYGRTKDIGLVLKGWAPQVLILGHPSVGGFLTHCGWNSVVESVVAEKPMLTWPLSWEQFFNEKLVTEVLRIGIEVGAEDWNRWIEVDKKVMIRREKIAESVRRLMDSGDEAMQKMREKVKELGEIAKRAVEKGGSSYANLTNLIEELKHTRDISEGT